MPDSNDTQYQLQTDGSLELGAAPKTWDGEPLYSADTVRERLFELAAFEQMRGQMALDGDDAR